MAEEIAALGLKVSTDGVQEANDSLNEMAQVAAKAEKAIESTGNSANKANKSLATLGQGTAAGLTALGSGAANANKSIDGMSKSATSAEQALQKVAATSNSIAAMTGDFKSVSDSIAQLNARINSSVTNFDKFGESIKGAGTKARETADSVDFLEKTAKRAGAALLTAFSVNALKNYADGWSDMQSKVGSATRDMEGAGDRMQRLVDIANASYSPLQQSVDVYARNVAVFRDLGRSATEAADFTEAVNHALVTTATRGQEAEVVIGALSRALATGKLDADAFDTISSRSNRVLEAIAARMSEVSGATQVTTSQLRALAMEGKVTSDVITTGLLNSLGALREEAGEMPATIADGLQRIENNLTKYIGNADQANGASRALANSLILIGNNIDVVVTAASALGLVLGARLAGPIVASGVAFGGATIQAARYQMTLASMAGVSASTAASFGVLTAATRTLSGAMGLLGGPWGVVLTAVGLAAGAFLAFRDSSKDATQALIDMSAPIEDVTAKLRDMSDAQRKVAENKLTAEQAEGVQKAEAAYKELYEALMNAAAASRMSSADMQKLGDEIDRAKENGTGYLDIVNRLSAAQYVPEGTKEKLEGLAGAFDTAKDIITAATEALERFRGVAATTPSKNDAANLTKQLEAEAAAMAKGAESYKSKAQATQDLLTKQSE